MSRRESTIQYCIKNGTKVSKDNIVAYIISKGCSGFMSSRIIKTEHTGYFFTVLPEQTVLKNESIIGIVLDKKVDLEEFKESRENVLNILKIVIEQGRIEPFLAFLQEKDRLNKTQMKEFIKSKYCLVIDSIFISYISISFTLIK